MEHTINEQEREQISEAIKAFERKSSAEIVTVIAKRSDDYLFIPILWAALGALAVPAVTMALGVALPLIQLYGLQLLIFLLLVLIGRFERLTMALIPRSVKRRRAAGAARSHFMALQLHTTKKRAGVMLFVSEAEHYVEIITDIEVANKIPDSEWEAIVQRFIANVKAGDTTEGYLEAIGRSGELLTPHFPYDPKETDELPNHLIVL
ncbi:TPM domain-containing protein [Sulfurimonas sp. HSL3-7]|uniref:TPM domain-containing protein n=1 Tax=Sulfonitrofixus jiaomeiensis TaxID=3131938 RepID=UPI0031F9D6BD